MAGIYTLRGATNILGTSLGPRGNLLAGCDLKFEVLSSRFEVFGTSNPELRTSNIPRLRLFGGEESVDEGVLCEFRRGVEIEQRHDLGFMKFDGLG